jgi:hypothetical protein
MANQDDLGGLTEDGINGKTPPSPKVADWLHGRVSVDKPTDLHHRIGTGQADAASGAHTHDGANSMPLWDEGADVLANLPASPTLAQVSTAVNAINALLRQKGAGGA